MKKKKYILVIFVVFILSIVLVRSLGQSYSASDSYYYVRRNMLSHHLIKNNKSNTASGTILVKTGTRTSSKDGESAVVYCAEQGSNNSTKSHTKKTLNSVSETLVSKTAKEKLSVIMPYSYPYITLGELKTYLKDSTFGIPLSDYSKYSFDNLDAQESMTAIQAAIWNAIKNTDRFVYSKTIPKISSTQSSFKAFGRINWQECSGYNVGTGTHATILTSEEKKWFEDSACTSSSNFYKYVFNVKEDGHSEQRINILIDWYAKLYEKEVPENPEPNFIIKDFDFETVNNELTFTVTINSSETDYTVAFYDFDGKLIRESEEVVANKDGNQFVIDKLPADLVGVNIEISTASNAKKVYYYQGSGQDWIGVDDTDSPYTTKFSLLNNEEKKGEIVLYKVSNSDINVSVDYTKTEVDNNICGEGCLSGAYFILYGNDKKTVIQEFITNESSFVIQNLPDGTYYLYEQDSPYGYNKYKFTGDNVDSDGYIKIDIKNGNMASVIVNNDVVKVCFAKVDSETKKLLDGGNFRIEDAEGGTYEEFSVTSQKDKYCLTGQLDSGYYYLVEETAPVNYIKTNKIFKFAVGEFNPDDIVVELEESEKVVFVETVDNLVTFENDPGPVISKSDLSSGACLAGAVLTVRDSKGNVVDKWTSSCEEGKETHMIDLEPGTYTLSEDQTPIGYATVEEITFTIDKDGKTNTSLDMKNDPIEVCFLKVAEGISEGLIGAEFDIYKADGTYYDSIVTDVSERCLSTVPVGEYILKETKAPEGYKINEEEIKITVKDTEERQLFEIENELDVPKTSMDYSRVIIIMAFVFMVFGLGFVGYYGVKKH